MPWVAQQFAGAQAPTEEQQEEFHQNSFSEEIKCYSQFEK
jgi:hypothetical protein